MSDTQITTVTLSQFPPLTIVQLPDCCGNCMSFLPMYSQCKLRIHKHPLGMAFETVRLGHHCPLHERNDQK